MEQYVGFAKEELNKYFSLITGETPDINLFVDGENEDDFFFEKCVVSVKAGTGNFIANSSRALLLGVYAFLRDIGCKFIRPGKLGEIIPKMKKEEINSEFVFSPENRHRGITIEGAVSIENVLSLIDWAPKAGFNTYFTQFTTSYEFFERWYLHKSNPYLEAESITEADAKKYISEIVSEIKKRDMIYHAVGHGWTASCIGITSNGWGVSDIVLSDEQKELVAEMGGERKLYKNTPLNTNLCYSNLKVRELLANKVVEYAESHPEVDVIHFWLADDFNNVCECSECAKKRVADYYVKILNLIDEKLTAKGLKTKICFLVYFDLYWTPLEEKIKNESRFIMMFAPIFRSYMQAFAGNDVGETEVMEYNRNKIDYPKSTAPYLAFLREWKKVFKGDTFDFDYHLMWDINRDFSGETIAKVLYDDIRSIKNIGLNGLLSCQIQRAFYPNGFAFYLMGRALIDSNLSFEEIRKEYYSSAFGKFEEYASDIYKTMQEKVSFAYMLDKVPYKDVENDLKEALEYLENKLAEPVSACGENAEVKESVEILRFVIGNVYRTVKVIVLKMDGEDKENVEKANKERKDFFNKNEMRFQPYADGFYVNMIVDGIIDAKSIGIYAEN